jgi:hypothetical protein
LLEPGVVEGSDFLHSIMLDDERWFHFFICKKMTEHGVASHSTTQEKEALKMPLAHKIMGTVLWDAK